MGPMAPLRPAFLAAFTAFLLSACALALPALGTAKHTTRHVRHTVRCGRRLHGKAGSYHAGHAPKRSSHKRHSASCPRKKTHHHAVVPKHITHRAPAPQHTRSSAADNGNCTGTELRPTAQNIETIRAATLCLVNRERAAQGEPALQSNSKLQASAQSHTESMAWGNYFEHIGPGGQTPLDRMRAAGYIYSSNLGFEVGENIAWGTGSLSTPRAIVAAWMGDPGHRANILDSHFRDSAVGVSPHPPSSLAHGQAGGIYTQDFGVITS